MRRWFLLAILPIVSHPLPAEPPVVGPPAGSLVIVGGGRIGPAIASRFIDLAGGLEAPVVVIPTAGTEDAFSEAYLKNHWLAKAGMKNLTLLHTRDRNLADVGAFVAPLARARAVWFDGGRHWRLADSYLDTRTHRELHALLARGGVIGGSSAGATIQGSYMVRGAREGNTIMMAPGYETGLGFLRGVAIDQHLLRRKRENDMVAVIEKHPELLGIGIDESTAVVVQGDAFDVVGESKVAVYDKGYGVGSDGKSYYFLNPGERFDLKKRVRIGR